MEAAWATRSRGMSRRLTHVISNDADFASVGLIQHPDFTTRSDRSRFFRCDRLHCLEHLPINQNKIQQASYCSAVRVTAIQ
jgi:hypothetical protein